MSLWVPPSVSHELQEETKKHNSMVMSMFNFTGGILDKWNKELQKFDPLMRLARAKPRADEAWCVPGYYHLVRFAETGPVTVIPLHDGQGGYVEPSNAMFDMLRESDLQNPQVTRAIAERKEAEKAAKEKEKLERRQQKTDLMMEQWRAHDRPKYNFDPDVRWSHSTDGKRGRKVVLDG